MYLHMGFLQLKAEGSPIPVPEVGTFERSVTSRPTLSSRHLYFNIIYWGNQFWKHQKAPDRSQEPSNTGGELINRNSSSLETKVSGIAPQPEESKTQPDFPTSVELHFNIDRPT